MQTTITSDAIEQMRSQYRNDPSARVLTAAMAGTDIADLAFLPLQAARLNGPFSIEVKTHGVTAQEKSGRCWMFAAMNICREAVIEKLDLSSFELSGNYLAFWDKLEKANSFLEAVIETAAEDPNSQKVCFLFTHAAGDGGLFDHFCSLVSKYGMVPKSVMPETYHSSHTAGLLKHLKSLLRKDGAELRRLIADGKDPYPRKEEMLAEFFKAECIAFGEPVERFDFTWQDTHGKYHADYDLTPKSFCEKYIGNLLDEYAYVACMPSTLKPCYTRYSYAGISCMAGHADTYLNLPIEEIQDLIIRQLEDGSPVWFGCSSDHFGRRDAGIWDPASFAYDALLGGIDTHMSREEALLYREASPSHNMIFTGVNLDEYGEPNRWKIENSWGKDAGRDGYFVCSQEYFRSYVYEAVIRKKYLSKTQLVLLEQEPVPLEPWEI